MPAIKKPFEYFNVVTYTGNGASSRAITGVGFQPDLVWIKSRSNPNPHELIDSVRGANKFLRSNATDAEGTFSFLTSFDSDGFTLGTNDNDVNGNGYTYVAWCWKANGTGVTNTAGSITSTVSANTSSGFSVVTYTGTNNQETIGHGLGAVPKMIIVKARSGGTENWAVYHNSIGAANKLFLNLTSASTATGNWQSTTPTSTVFYVDGASTSVNSSGYTYVAYCFSAVAGYSAFGSYVGNGSTDGTFVALPFKPKFVMIKQSSASGENWEMWDSTRGLYNINTPLLYANLSNAETAGSAARFDALSNGFKIRSTNAGVNASGATYVYAAFAEVPQKFALGV